MTDFTQYVNQTGVCNSFEIDSDILCSDNNKQGKQISDKAVETGLIKECTRLCDNECPPLGKGLISFEWKNDIDNFKNVDNKAVSCNYDAENFTLNDVKQYIIAYGKDDNYNNILMPTYCFQETTKCVNNPNTNEPWESCPNILSTTGAGRLCKDWRSSNIDLADDTQLEYCDNNSDNGTCACYNRSDNQVYDLINEDIDYNDGCWYKPCTSPDSYLVSSNLINTDPPCPCQDEICDNINVVIGNSQSNLPQSAFEEVILCPITSTPIPIPEPTKSSSSSTFFIIGIIIFIFIIIIILGLVYYFSYYNKQSTPVYRTVQPTQQSNIYQNPNQVQNYY